MTAVLWWLALLTLAVVALGVLVLTGEYRALLARPRHPAAPSRPVSTPEPAPAAEPGAAFFTDPNELLAPPPMIDGVVLRDWLIHHHRKDDNVWRDVVVEFYDLAAADDHIRQFFRHTDLPTLRQHFTRTLVKVTGEGVTASDVHYLATKHTFVDDAAGQPITPAVWDKVVGVLVGVLRSKGVPSQGIAALAETIAPLRPALVREG
jgi:truncated hemoglobin YjbI